MMDLTPLLLAMSLILVHRADGQEVLLAPQHIVSLNYTMAAQGGRNKLVTGEALCVIGLLDRKFVSVRESCQTVQQMMQEATK